MRMNFKYLTMLAATAAVALTGCSMEGDDTNKGIDNNAKALFTITVSGPETYATDANATASEVAVNSIDVFVYAQDAETLIDHETRSGSQIVPVTGSPNTWTLANGSEIVTKAGNKTIFVGLNLTSAMASAIVSNGLKEQQTIAKLNELCAENKFVMFSSEPASKNLEEIGDEANPTVNVVTTSVSRLVSKILFYGETSYSAGGQGTVKGLQFTAANVNNQFYPLPDLANYYDPNFATGDMTASFLQYAEPVVNVCEFAAVNHVSTPTNQLKAVYATENTAKKGSVAGAFTYGIVKAVYTPAEISTWDGTNLTTSAAAEGATFYAVRYTDTNNDKQTVFFANEANANLFVTDKVGGAPADHVRPYTNGVCYYGVIFNGTEKGTASAHSIYRNTLYRVTVDAVKGLGSHTWELYPDDPLFPPIIIPTDPPTDPQDETALLSIIVGIEPWVIETPQATVLGND